METTTNEYRHYRMVYYLYSLLLHYNATLTVEIGSGVEAGQRSKEGRGCFKTHFFERCLASIDRY